MSIFNTFLQLPAIVAWNPKKSTLIFALKIEFDINFYGADFPLKYIEHFLIWEMLLIPTHKFYILTNF